HREAVEIDRAARVAALHFILQRPPDVLQLGVAHLETISYLYLARIETQCLRRPVQKRRAYAQGEKGVFSFHLPGGRRVCGDDMNFAVQRRSAVVVSGPATGDMNGRPGVYGNPRRFLAGDFGQARRVGQETDAKSIMAELRGRRLSIHLTNTP